MSYMQRAALENHNYWNDPRVIRSLQRSVYTVNVEGGFVELREGIADQIEDAAEEGEPLPAWYEEHGSELPARILRSPCQGCGGTRRMVNPSIDCGGFDPQSDQDLEDYMGGVYDVTCSYCDGTGAHYEVIILNAEARRFVREWEQEEADFASLCAAERAFGC